MLAKVHPAALPTVERTDQPLTSAVHLSQRRKPLTPQLSAAVVQGTDWTVRSASQQKLVS